MVKPNHFTGLHNRQQLCILHHEEYLARSYRNVS